MTNRLNSLLYIFHRTGYRLFFLEYFKVRAIRYLEQTPRGLERKAEFDKMTADIKSLTSFH